MSQRDLQTIDPDQHTVRIADDVVVWPVCERGKWVYRLEIPSLHKFFRVGYEEYVFLSLLDGRTTISQAVGLAAAKLKQRAPTTEQAESILRWLLQNELAHHSDTPAPNRDQPRRRPTSWLSRWNPFWIKVPCCRMGRDESPTWIDSLAGSLSFLFSPLAVLIGCLLILAGGISLTMHWHQFVQSSAPVVSSSNWIWLLVTWIGLKVVHELAHAAACHRHGGAVSEAGIVLVLLAPLAYVDVSRCWRMNSRWRRIGVSMAGMYVEWVVAAIGVLLLTQSQSPLVEHVLYNLIITAGVSTILFNANVLMRFDGYFVLADWVDMPNLYNESFHELKRLAQRIGFAVPVPPSPFVGWRLWLLRFYGVAALFWKATICVTLAIAAATMFAGAGIVIAILGVAMWLGRPLWKLALFVQGQFDTNVASTVRGCVITAAVVTVLVAGVLYVPISTAVRAPAVVRFAPKSSVRSAADGFVVAVHVTDSAHVQPGDLLVELDNPELHQRLLALRVALAKSQLQQRSAKQAGDASLAQVHQQASDSLRSQIANIESQVNALQVRANRNGRVHARNLQRLVGTFVRQGDVLMTVADDHEKEIVALVHQDHIAAVRKNVANQIPLRTADRQSMIGTVELVEPRAKFRLDIASLSAANGGPLAVRPASNDEVPDEVPNEATDDQTRLLQPHFAARISLARKTAASLPAGMRVEALMGYRSEPIAKRISNRITKIWHRANGDG